MAKIDIARALKDLEYFNSLSVEEQAEVTAANPVGNVNLTDGDLESVSGGLEGGDKIASTTTTTELKSCTCLAAAVPREGCTCAC